MRWLLLVFIALLPPPSYAWTRGRSTPIAAVSCDFTTGNCVGTGGGSSLFTAAACDGSSSDTVAAASFNSWAVSSTANSTGQLIELFIPSGKTCLIGGAVACNANTTVGCVFINIKNLFVSFYGSRILFGSDVISTGGLGLFDGGSARRSTRLATVNAGDSCANVLTPAQASIFSVGNYVMISGFDMQGLWRPTGPSFGWPPNHYYYEYPMVSAIDTSHNCSGSAGGSISFTAAGTRTYLSTWPLYDPGSGSNNLGDEGGPASLYLLDPSWNCSIEFRGGSLERTANQLGAGCRTVTLTDITMTGSSCFIPSTNYLFTYTNVTGPNCVLEIDKLDSTVAWNGGSVDIINFQSASPDLMTMSNVAVTQFTGAPKRFVGDHVTMGLTGIGATAYGRTNEWTCTKCVVNSLIGALGANENGSLVSGVWTLPGQDSGSYASSMSGGVITVPNTHGAVTWGVPGTNLTFSGADQNELAFQVTGVTQDATNTYLQTSLSGGFPAIPLGGGSTLRVSALGAPKFNCPGCTGTDPQIASLAQAPANAPIYSYQTYTYTGAVGGTVQPKFTMWGNLVQADYDVTSAYTGAGSLSIQLSQFNNWDVILSTLSGGSYNSAGSGPSINAKSAGHRRVTPIGVTCVSGTCTGDSGLATLDAAGMWFAGPSNSGPIYSADVSGSCPGAGCPSATITIQTNQGVVNPPN